MAPALVDTVNKDREEHPAVNFHMRLQSGGRAWAAGANRGLGPLKNRKHQLYTVHRGMDEYY